MDLKIRNEISRSNSFTFSNISSLNGGASPVDQQLSKLVKFVQCQRHEIVRKELETLLPPLVCHLFIEMLKGKDWRPAHDFLRKHSSLVGNVQDMPPQKINGTDPSAITPQQIHFLHHHNFHQSSSKQLNVEEQKLCVFRELITSLSCVRRLEDAKDNKLIINFRSCKYKAALARKSLAILNKYLSKHGHVLIIQILHVWFSMDLYELHEESNDDSESSASSIDLPQLNHFADAVKQPQHRNHHRIDRFSDCDNPKDIKFSVNSSRFDYDAPLTNEMDAENGSNLKMKRLQECLHRVDSKYHKPIRIFNINYTENR
jgi:WD40 associated region in TFIID subunit, NTD2 domain